MAPRRPARSRPTPARRPARPVQPGVRAWLVIGGIALAALLPPTRALARVAWRRVEEVMAAARAEEARQLVVSGYARRYGIALDLADDIERAARAEGIDTELAFRLVRVESAFREGAVSHVGALGLTQVMPATAAMLQPGITPAQLLERETNLRLGFRYLKELMAAYDGDAEEALTAYNRGPGTVRRIRSAGGDPGNGYAELVLGERGRSPVNLVRHDSADDVRTLPLHETGVVRDPRY